MNSIHPSIEEQWKVAEQKRGLFLWMEMDDGRSMPKRNIIEWSAWLELCFCEISPKEWYIHVHYVNLVDLIQSYLFSILFFAMRDHPTAHLHIGHREVVIAWGKRTRCVSFSGWPVFCSGISFFVILSGKKMGSSRSSQWEFPQESEFNAFLLAGCSKPWDTGVDSRCLHWWPPNTSCSQRDFSLTDYE